MLQLKMIVVNIEKWSWWETRESQRITVWIEVKCKYLGGHIWSGIRKSSDYADGAKLC